MAKEKTAHAYELELRKMVQARTAEDCPVWLYPLINTTAYNMVVRDKIQNEILSLKSLIVPVMGSTGQVKNEVSPLLPHYDKIQRTITQQLTAIGLTFDTTPSKVIEDTKKGAEDNDPLVAFYKGSKSSWDALPDM